MRAAGLAGVVWIEPPAPETGAEFGIGVDVSGTAAIVGAWKADAGDHIDCGTAEIFRRTGAVWTHEATLWSSEAAADDWAGRGVAIDGDVAALGMYQSDPLGVFAAGRVAVFRRVDGLWLEEATLEASPPTVGANLGMSVAIDGDVLVAGAWLESTGGGYRAGAAHVFRHSDDGWAEEAVLTMSDGSPHDYFGRAVAVDGDRIVVGAYQYDTASVTNAGALVVFHWTGSGWVEEAVLIADEAAPEDALGRSVAISGDYVVGGAKNADLGASNTGGAWVFARHDGVWSQDGILTPVDAAGGDSFGIAVALDGDVAVVGGWRDDTAAGNDAGSARIYKRIAGGWVEVTDAAMEGSAVGDLAGYAVAIDGQQVVCGAYKRDAGGFHAAGSVCSQVLASCSGDLNLDDVVDVMDLIQLLDGWGTPAADVDGDGVSDITDVLLLIGAFGLC